MVKINFNQKIASLKAQITEYESLGLKEGAQILKAQLDGVIRGDELKKFAMHGVAYICKYCGKKAASGLLCPANELHVYIRSDL